MTRRSPVDVTRCPGPSQQADVTGWRRHRLLEAGFECGVAERLATSRAIDLHALLELVDRGCAPALAVRILNPIENKDPLT
jgi:hypothetical protein